LLLAEVLARLGARWDEEGADDADHACTGEEGGHPMTTGDHGAGAGAKRTGPELLFALRETIANSDKAKSFGDGVWVVREDALALIAYVDDTVAQSAAIEARYAPLLATVRRAVHGEGYAYWSKQPAIHDLEVALAALDRAQGDVPRMDG